MKKSYLLILVGILIVVVIVAITVTLVLVLRKHHKETPTGTSLDDIISENSTFPNGSYTVPVNSLKPLIADMAPLFVDISMLNELGLEVDNSSNIAESGGLSYFFVRMPYLNESEISLITSTGTNNLYEYNVGIRFGNSSMLNVVPLSLSSEMNSGVKTVGVLDDISTVYQIEARMAEAMCSSSEIGSCTQVNWGVYAISSDGKSGIVGNFENEMHVACGSICDGSNSACASSSCVPCDGQTYAGANTRVTRRYKMGTVAASLNFSYETYEVPDRVTVSYEGANIFDSTCIGTNGERVAPISFSDVEPNCDGTTSTAWYFLVPCVNCDGCQEYKCMDDSIAHCGSNGYLQAFGLYFCNRYFDPQYYNIFNTEGQAFINCVRPRLLDFIENYVQASSGAVDCTDLYNKAFDSHVAIYVDCGFCSAFFSLSNARGFVEVVYKSLNSLKPWEQIASTAYQCAKLGAGEVGNESMKILCTGLSVICSSLIGDVPPMSDVCAAILPMCSNFISTAKPVV